MKMPETMNHDDQNGSEVHVQDSSLDYKGRLAIRDSTGSWKASAFILAIEFSERLSYFGLATNMITYMTKVMHQDLVTAVNNVNVWGGVTTVMPLLGGFLADAYIGRYFMILFSAVLYFLGLGLFAMSQFIPSLKPCGSTTNTCPQVSKVHELVFFISAYTISIATGGYKPCLESFGADQFDDNHTKERKQKMSFFNWWNVSLCSGLFIGVTLIVYVQDYVSWGVGYLILAITMGVTILLFLLGRPFYRYRIAIGSPLTPLLQVLVAAIAKRKLASPHPSLLYEVPNSTKLQGRLLGHTNRLRFLDKAAIIQTQENNEALDKEQSPWKLSTITQVEELKLLIAMLPIWLTCLVFGIGIAQGTTFFIKQGTTMNRKLSKNNFEIPAASMSALIAIGMIASISIYDKLLLPYLRKITKNERGINILARIGIGMIILIISMIISALVENSRLNSSYNGQRMSVLWLAPQFLVLGIGDGFSLVGMQEFFYEQVPDSMRSLGMAFYLSIIGVGSFCSSFLIIVVDHVTGLNGGEKWIGKDLNHSRLDYFYWLLTILFVLNMCVYVYLARNYRYKNVQRDVSNDSCNGEMNVDQVGVSEEIM